MRAVAQPGSSQPGSSSGTFSQRGALSRFLCGASKSVTLLEGIAQSRKLLTSVVLSNVFRCRQSKLVIALARQPGEGVFEAGDSQLEVLWPVAVRPLRASNSEIRLSGGTVGAASRGSLSQLVCGPRRSARFWRGSCSRATPPCFSFCLTSTDAGKRPSCVTGPPGGRIGGSWRLGS